MSTREIQGHLAEIYDAMLDGLRNAKCSEQRRNVSVHTVVLLYA
jgi:hypothetical protein